MELEQQQKEEEEEQEQKKGGKKQMLPPCSALAPVVRLPSTSHSLRGPGRRAGVSFLLSPNALAKSETVLSPLEAERRLKLLASFNSTSDLMELDDEAFVATASQQQHLTAEEKVLLRETHESTKQSTPQDVFEDFLARQLQTEAIVKRISEDAMHELFEFKHCLGDGATSSVRVAVRKADSQYFAIKAIPAKLFVRHRSLLREVAILSKIRHPNVVRLHASFLTDENLYLVLDLVEGEPLFDHIVRRKTYNENDARELSRTLLETMKYLHSLDIAHRDLKPENVMVEETTGKVVILDFGFAGIDDKESGLTSPGGTPGYKAPEYFSASHGRSVDIWSIGVISYILLCGFPPFFSDHSLRDTLDFLSATPFWFFMNQETDELRAEIANGNIVFPSPFWDSISTEAKDFIRRLLNINEQGRFTAEQALMHPWMRVSDPTISPETHLLVDSALARASPSVLKSSLEGLPAIVQDRVLRLRGQLDQLEE